MCLVYHTKNLRYNFTDMSLYIKLNQNSGDKRETQANHGGDEEK